MTSDFEIETMGLPEDTSDELRRSLAALLKDDIGDALRDAVRPLIKDAFHRGAAFAVRQMMELGAQYLALLDAESQATIEDRRSLPQIREQRRPVARRSSARRRRASVGRPRAASGAVGQAIDLVLAERPGLRIVEIQDLVADLDPTVARTSVTNELRRKKGMRYRQEGVRWYRIGGTEKKSGLARHSTVPESSVGGPEVGDVPLRSSGAQAA